MTLPNPYYQEPGVTIYHGNCYDIVPLLPKANLILTDPPYELATAGGKPIAFGGNPRTYQQDITTAKLHTGFDPKILEFCDNWFCFCSKAQLWKLIDIARRGGV